MSWQPFNQDIAMTQPCSIFLVKFMIIVLIPLQRNKVKNGYNYRSGKEQKYWKN